MTIEGGVGRGSPFEKWIVARATKAATMSAKPAVRRISYILAPMPETSQRARPQNYRRKRKDDDGLR
jgi:hypothetical protein